MKNLKIGVKILIGFLSVIALMLVITVTVIITSMQTIDNVNRIDKGSSLQTSANDMLSNFLNARVPANKMLFSTDKSFFDDFNTYKANISELFNNLYTIIGSAQFLESFKAPIQDIEKSANEWIEAVNNVNKTNEELIKNNDDLVRYGSIIAEITNSIISDQLRSLINDINRGTTNIALMKRSNQVSDANDIKSLIMEFRINARNMTSTFNVSLLPGTLETLDQSLNLLNKYHDEVTDDSQINLTEQMIEAITGYRAALVEFGTICSEKDAESIQMPLLNQVAQDKINETLATIDDTMVNRIDSTTSSSFMTLFIVIAISAASLIFAITMATIIIRSITKPLNAMYGTIVKVNETGSFNFTEAEKDDLNSHISKNEIGQSIEAFSSMLDRLILIAKALDEIAHGDLSITLKTISKDDTIGNAMVYMLKNLNDMFRRINEAGEQVNSGSDQVSSASQALAQGATEQASSIQELSASIQQISSQVNENSGNAEKAFTIANETNEEVITGNTQMQHMLEAMNDINNSSNEISKIIKVIEDIAFQTNILALNAAVEAARAGEAGKGFAVVADEVRNLASKSADAAKQTTDLISGSVQSVGKGAEIAKKTAQSLELIEQKTKEVNEYISEIASASREQAEGIAQINIGVEQISSVIQTNSATAEESAAAAEELSSQASILNEQIATFKLA